jgi:hypothetical protein
MNELEQELELEGELSAEGEFAHEHEHELEGEFEGELEGEGELELELEGEFEGEGELGGLLSGLLGEGEGEGEGELELELEGEHEFEHEHEHELNPVRKVYLDAVLEMEHLGAMMAQAESEHEAEQFFPALIPLAAKALPFLAKGAAKLGAKFLPRLLPRAARLLGRFKRPLFNAARRLGRGLIRGGRRRLCRAIPSIMRQAAGTIQRRVAQGQPVTPQAVRRIVAAHTQRVMRNPSALNQAVARSQRADRIYHQRVASGRLVPATTAGFVRVRRRRRGCGCSGCGGCGGCGGGCGCRSRCGC